jgi:hypothetical protein
MKEPVDEGLKRDREKAEDVSALDPSSIPVRYPFYSVEDP